MAFYHPIIRRNERLDPQLIILMTAFFLLLVSFFVVSAIQHIRKETTAIDSVIATSTVPLFFSKIQGSQSITEGAPRKLSQQASAIPLKSALEALLKGPNADEVQAGFYSEIPKGTSLLSLSANKHVLTINLSKEFTSGSGATSVIQRVEELKNTVSALDKQHRIQIAIEGKPLTVLSGEGLELE
jgi:spore germination protein GerM